jgi:hypothetical protein
MICPNCGGDNADTYTVQWRLELTRLVAQRDLYRQVLKEIDKGLFEVEQAFGCTADDLVRQWLE